MFHYKPGDDVGTLTLWPFDNPHSQYRIVSGDPQASGRIDQGGPGHTTRLGIWRCTVGTFDCTEQGDELMMILSGRCRISWLDGTGTCSLEPGDTLFVQDQSRVRWDIIQDLTKAFFAHKAEGY